MAVPQFKNLVTGIEVDFTGCAVDDLSVTCGVGISAGGDEVWDDVVARAVAEELVGVEALSGVGGSVAVVTRANVEAYGQSLGDSVSSVRTWDRLLGAQKTFPAVDCGFGPGTSRFQELLDDGSLRYEILEVSLLVTQAYLTRPLQDATLVGMLGVELGARARIDEVRARLLSA